MSHDITALADRTEPVERESIADSFRLSVVLLIVVMLAQRVIGLARNVLLCGLLTEEELGRWSLANNYLGWAAPFVVLGLPGSFGRLSEHFRHQGQLRRFLQHTALASIGLMGAATLAHALVPSWFARLVYNNQNQVPVIPVLGLVLSIVITLNFLVEFLTSVRCNRIVSRIYLVQSLLFAVFSVALLWLTPLREMAVLIAFGASSAVAAVIGVGPVVQHWREAPAVSPVAPAGSMWRRIVTLAVWVWIGNSVANLFDFSDQFLLKHFLTLPPELADAMIGQLYASRVLPIMIVSVAVLVGGCLLPYLIKDCESGRPLAAQERMNSVIKFAAIGFTLIGAVTHVVSPVLFNWMLKGKHQEGLEIMPWAFVQYSWFGLAAIASRYLICIDRPRMTILPLLAGLMSAMGLVVWLTPHFGLPGVAIAMTVANGLAFFALLWTTGCCGMKWDRKTLLAAWVPLTMCLGGWVSLGMTTLLLLAGWRPQWLLTTAEREQIQSTCESMLSRFTRLPSRSMPSQ